MRSNSSNYYKRSSNNNNNKEAFLSRCNSPDPKNKLLSHRPHNPHLPLNYLHKCSSNLRYRLRHLARNKNSSSLSSQPHSHNSSKEMPQ